MAFGSGVLISALTFELMREAYDTAGATAAVLGLLAGSLVFFCGDWLIDRRGGNRRKSPNGPQAGAGATALVLGALLDGIPECAAIGVSLIGGGGVGVAVVAAVFLSNIPESLSASAGMKATGRSTRYILGLWLAVPLASTVAAALGFGVLSGGGPRCDHRGDPGLRRRRHPDDARRHDGARGGRARGRSGGPADRDRVRCRLPALGGLTRPREGLHAPIAGRCHRG